MDDPLDGPVDPMTRREEAAAALEAGRIGGFPGYARNDPAQQALIEAGEGDAEGFEDAELELMEQASHGESLSSPELDAFAPERESDRVTAAFGEPDEVDPTEVLGDPREGPADPGYGTPIAPDR